MIKSEWYQILAKKFGEAGTVITFLVGDKGCCKLSGEISGYL